MGANAGQPRSPLAHRVARKDVLDVPLLAGLYGLENESEVTGRTGAFEDIAVRVGMGRAPVEAPVADGDHLGSLGGGVVHDDVPRL